LAGALAGLDSARMILSRSNGDLTPRCEDTETSNAQRRNEGVGDNSMFDVECSVFDVFRLRLGD
jgi:hypothetical protein